MGLVPLLYEPMHQVFGCSAGASTMTAKGMAGLPAGPADKRRSGDVAAVPASASATQQSSTAAQLQGGAGAGEPS